MDPQTEVLSLKAKIKELEAKNGMLEAENQGLKDQLTMIVNPEEREDIRAQITANTEQITANTNLMTEYLKTINATITTTGNIHVRWQFILE